MKQSLDLVSTVGEGKKFMNEIQVIFWNIGCDYFSKKAMEPAKKMFELFIKYSSSDDLNRCLFIYTWGKCSIVASYDKHFSKACLPQARCLSI